MMFCKLDCESHDYRLAGADSELEFQIAHKLRHLDLIAAPGSFVSVATCDDCGGRENTVQTVSVFSSCCSDCGLISFRKVGDNSK